MVIQQIPSFDPNPSLKAAIDFLQEAKIDNYALIGRVATWVFLPADRQQFTKDVDLAILTRDSAKIEEVLKMKGFKTYPLSIGGVAVRESDIVVDFIDRRVDGLDLLFSEAIENARKDVEIFDRIVPVVNLPYLITMKLVSGENKDDQDAKSLLMVEGLKYEVLRQLVKRHLGTGTANRLDVFARDVGLLPARGSYKMSGPS